jgi:hypothetical protein
MKKKKIEFKARHLFLIVFFAILLSAVNTDYDIFWLGKIIMAGFLFTWFLMDRIEEKL